MDTDSHLLLAKAKKWTQAPFDEDTRLAVSDLMHDEVLLKECFYKDLEFGTGGMRGIMGVGTNRINKYTLGRNTQGLSNYLKKQFPQETLKAVIAYDCRNQSNVLAQVVADVFAANDIEVYLFSELRPTPELSFAVKFLKCHVGIVLTASHNPPEYNGYKVYWRDGAQVVPPQDGEIVSEISKVGFDQIRFDADKAKIHSIDKEIDEAFISASLKNGSFEIRGRQELKIVFTSLHGTSITVVPEVMKSAGYTRLYIVEEQATPDGNFPTVKSPNPEEPEALTLALRLAEKQGADLVIGTDPDCDRLGLAIRDNEGKMLLLNGNQTMLLMTRFLLNQWQKKNRLKGKEFVGSTIVSTPMMSVLAAHYGVQCKLGLTGFKWIAKMIQDFPDLEFIGGGEESFGYMIGDFVRDKDAVTASLLACEMATEAKSRGNTLFDELIASYLEHGFYLERLISLEKKGISGAQEIQEMMQNLRLNPPKSIGGSMVLRMDDYENLISVDLEKQKTSIIDMPKSNVLLFSLNDGSQIAARPSGTEPKIKFYVSVNAPLRKKNEYFHVKEQLEKRISTLLKDFGL